MGPNALIQTLLFQCLFLLLSVLSCVYFSMINRKIAISLFIKKSKPCHVASLPDELLRDIVARVAASSFRDYVNIKKSCKLFKEVAESSYVLKHVNLDDLPMVEWHNKKKKGYARFLEQCVASENTEALYRRGSVEYLLRDKEDTALKYFIKCMNSNHAGAYYTSIFIMLHDSQDRFNQSGIAMLSAMKKSVKYREKIKFYREIMIELLKTNWGRLNPSRPRVILKNPPVCCTKRGNRHMKDNFWVSMVNCFDEQCMSCDGCICDRELAYICNSLPHA